MKIIDIVKKYGLPFGIIPYSKCRVIKPHLTEKSNINPDSVIIFLAPYFAEDFNNRNVSLYAVAKDYHLFFEKLFGDITADLKHHYPDNSFVGFADHSPINEVDAAAKAGLGVVGENGLLINNTYGSYVFIGEILTDIPFAYGGTEDFHAKQCSKCGKCHNICPKTEKCLSAITQTKGDLSESEKLLIKNNSCAWGCDICQTVCPMNANVKTTDIPFFKEDLLPVIDFETLSQMTDEEFKNRAYSWRGRSCILRNLEILENKGR